MVIVAGCLHRRRGAVGADVPTQVQQLPAVEARLLENGVTIRADLPLLLGSAPATRTNDALLQVLQQRLLLQ